MIASETPAPEDLPAMSKSNYRASGLVRRPVADLPFCVSCLPEVV